MQLFPNCTQKHVITYTNEAKHRHEIWDIFLKQKDDMTPGNKMAYVKNSESAANMPKMTTPLVSSEQIELQFLKHSNIQNGYFRRVINGYIK